MFAIEECIRTAQRGGVGVVVYFRKEGRALGEVTKLVHLSCVLAFPQRTGNLPTCDRYLVYNLRKRGGDSADKYFKSTELIAGVKDMRFQALMPDVLHWLGITKIDNMISMSDMYGPSSMFSIADVFYRTYSDFCPICRKHDAIVGSGIPIVRRYDLPGTHVHTNREVTLTHMD